MITLARILEAYMNAEQFDFPLDDRSLVWHILKLPIYALSIFSFWAYSEISKRVDWLEPGDQRWVLVGLLVFDIGLAWLAFEYFLDYFRA